MALGNKVDALELLGRMKEAHKVADEAISIVRELKDQDDLGMALNRKAEIFYNQKVSHCRRRFHSSFEPNCLQKYAAAISLLEEARSILP